MQTVVIWNSDSDELEYVREHWAEMEHIARELCDPSQFKKYNYKVEELSGGMKTPTSVTEIQAQVQVFFGIFSSLFDEFI